MTIIIAPNAFKGTLTALQACEAVYKGVKPVLPRAKFILCPLADGGDGTLDVLKFYDKALKVIRANVTNPEGHKISASFLYNSKTREAFIECAEASGMKTLKGSRRDIMRFTSYGTGELVLKALDKGAKKIVVGIGGTATNDSGLGMLRALGFTFYAKDRTEIKTVKELHALRFINAADADTRLKTTQFYAACDVSNPLLGSKGATFTYGGQKGADNNEKKVLETCLKTFSRKTRETKGKNINRTFCGAGGGMGAALYGYLNAKLDYGFSIISKTAKLVKHIKRASFVITGEGKVDFQTKFGKVPFFVAKLCKENHIPCICIAGAIGDGAKTLHHEGMTAILSTIIGIVSEQDIKKHAKENLTRTAQEIARIIDIK